MTILLHVTAALLSLGLATSAFFAPSKLKLRTSWALAAATLASGTYLVVSTGTPVLQTCLTGIAYLGSVSVMVFLAQRKLAARSVHNRK